MKFAPFHSRSRHGGFTLVELLLAVTLLAGLMGAAVFGFSSLQRSAQLNEGVERVETAMRFARAHAANTGRKVQVVVTTTIDANASPSSASSADKAASNGNGNNYGSSNGNEPLHSLSILWEADPARAPGVFESIPSLSGDVADVSELVEIRSVGRESKNSESNDGSTTQDSQDVGYPRTQTATASDSLEFSNNSMNSGSSFSANDTSDSEMSSEASRPSGGGVNPGETKEWVIRFDKAQTLQMACLIPGHFEAGMKGQLLVENKGAAVPSSKSAKPANSHDHSTHKH